MTDDVKRSGNGKNKFGQKVFVRPAMVVAGVSGLCLLGGCGQTWYDITGTRPAQAGAGARHAPVMNPGGEAQQQAAAALAVSDRATPPNPAPAPKHTGEPVPYDRYDASGNEVPQPENATADGGFFGRLTGNANNSDNTKRKPFPNNPGYSGDVQADAPARDASQMPAATGLTTAAGATVNAGDANMPASATAQADAPAQPAGADTQAPAGHSWFYNFFHSKTNDEAATPPATEPQAANASVTNQQDVVPAPAAGVEPEKLSVASSAEPLKPIDMHPDKPAEPIVAAHQPDASQDKAVDAANVTPASESPIPTQRAAVDEPKQVADSVAPAAVEKSAPAEMAHENNGATQAASPDGYMKFADMGQAGVEPARQLDDAVRPVGPVEPASPAATVADTDTPVADAAPMQQAERQPVGEAPAPVVDNSIPIANAKPAGDADKKSEDHTWFFGLFGRKSTNDPDADQQTAPYPTLGSTPATPSEFKDVKAAKQGDFQNLQNDHAMAAEAKQQLDQEPSQQAQTPVEMPKSPMPTGDVSQGEPGKDAEPSAPVLLGHANDPDAPVTPVDAALPAPDNAALAGSQPATADKAPATDDNYTTIQLPASDEANKAADAHFVPASPPAEPVPPFAAEKTPSAPVTDMPALSSSDALPSTGNQATPATGVSATNDDATPPSGQPQPAMAAEPAAPETPAEPASLSAQENMGAGDHKAPEASASAPATDLPALVPAAAPVASVQVQEPAANAGSSGLPGLPSAQLLDEVKVLPASRYSARAQAIQQRATGQ